MEKFVLRKVDAGELLMANLKKVAEAAKAMEADRPLDVAYLAGRMDGLADALMMQRGPDNKTA
jgi:hypothetical protein